MDGSVWHGKWHVLDENTAQQHGTCASPTATRPPEPGGGGSLPRYLVVAVHASVQQDPHHGLVAVPRRQVQGRVLLSVAAQEVGVGVEQHLHHLQPPV